MLKYDLRKRRLMFSGGTTLNQCDLLEDEPNEPMVDAGGSLAAHNQPINNVINIAGQEEVDHLPVEVELIYLDDMP